MMDPWEKEDFYCTELQVGDGTSLYFHAMRCTAPQAVNVLRIGISTSLPTAEETARKPDKPPLGAKDFALMLVQNVAIFLEPVTQKAKIIPQDDARAVIVKATPRFEQNDPTIRAYVKKVLHLSTGAEIENPNLDKDPMTQHFLSILLGENIQLPIASIPADPTIDQEEIPDRLVFSYDLNPDDVDFKG